MLKTELVFENGATDALKRMVSGITTPQAIMNAYRNARAMYGTTDIVLHTSDRDPEIRGGTRREYCEHLKRLLGVRASKLRIWKHSAQSVMMLPSDSDAMWLVIEGRNLDVPLSCAFYAMPYEQDEVTAN